MSTPTAIITGAGGAIAQHVIKAFSDADWSLALVAFDQREHDRLHEDHPRCVVVSSDLADPDSAKSALDTAVKQLGPAHALLNIAGGFAMANAIDTSAADLETQLSINFRTAFNAVGAVLPAMLERGDGFILGVGAAAALDGGAGMGAYAASKAALIAWLKSVRAEVAAKGVDVSILYPMAAVDTPGNRAAMPKSDPGEWLDPRELAATILHLATRSRRGRVLEARVYPPG